MIFISTSCIQANTISQAVEVLYKRGFSNIEITGGIDYYKDADKDILSLKNKFGPNYLCHNYFLPMKKPFVLNLASLNRKIFNKSLLYFEKVISLAESLGSKKFGLHAGFLVDLEVKEMGGKLTWRPMYDPEEAMEVFCSGFNHLKSKFHKIELYIENNVLSCSDFKACKYNNPYLLTHFDTYKKMRKQIDLKMLLDIAHLKVSAHSLGLDFIRELNKFMEITDYIHISENDGIYDENAGFDRNSFLLKELKNFDLSSKTITIEVSRNITKAIDSYHALEDFFTLTCRK